MDTQAGLLTMELSSYWGDISAQTPRRYSTWALGLQQDHSLYLFLSSKTIQINASIGLIFLNERYFSMSCGIADSNNDVYYITGNRNINYSKSATIYEEKGYLDDLAPLNRGRRNHACSGYYNHEKHFVLVVVGGLSDHQCKS